MTLVDVKKQAEQLAQLQLEQVREALGEAERGLSCLDDVRQLYGEGAGRQIHEALQVARGLDAKLQGLQKKVAEHFRQVAAPDDEAS